ncbi:MULTISPECIES: response regulator transcription factor [unclassified Microbacterium]|uniref:response regulator transcription factor n=1 Tax=unclassified Microbacterium TaxID=2609290 RepID=UPI0030179A26
MRIRVLLVDDHPFYRDGVRTMLGEEDGIEIVGEAGTGEEALAWCARSGADAVDVAVMDLSMPGGGGLAAIRRFAAVAPGVRTLVLTMHDDETVLQALRAGARGYLVKNAEIDELARAIRAVAAGEVILSPAVAGHLLAHVAVGRPATVIPGLTEREHEVLALLADDLAPAEIARRLGLAPKTVHNYVGNVLAKLHARDRAEAAARARAAGLGERGDPGSR